MKRASAVLFGVRESARSHDISPLIPISGPVNSNLERSACSGRDDLAFAEGGESRLNLGLGRIMKHLYIEVGVGLRSARSAQRSTSTRNPYRSALWTTAPFFILAVSVLVPASSARAQRSNENAILDADDAFGGAVGNERTGIYTESDVRGFSPVRAGNVRIEGSYIDQQASLALPSRREIRIRVGIPALTYPFPSPSGIVDYQLREAAGRPILSTGLSRLAYGGVLFEQGVGLPVSDNLSVTAGASYNRLISADGARENYYAIAMVPRLKTENGELTFVLSHFIGRNMMGHTIVSSPGPLLPPVLPTAENFGQHWAIGRSSNTNLGIIYKSKLDEKWFMRFSLFKSRLSKDGNFSNILLLSADNTSARQLIAVGPTQINRSYSGELQLSRLVETGSLTQRFLINLRWRDRVSASGESDVLDLGSISFGQAHQFERPVFQLRNPSRTSVRQWTPGIGYLTKLGDMGTLNIGLQKTFYNSVKNTGMDAATSSRSWLYNAMLAVSLRPQLVIFAGTSRGLEESGFAPENALNRGENLPATHTRQIELGMRTEIARMQVLATVFRIEKPYFNFLNSGFFTNIGTVRHQGVELSLSGKPVPALTILAGAVVMRPEVVSQSSNISVTGSRPVGVADLSLRLDSEYSIRGTGLSGTLSILYLGKRAASAGIYRGFRAQVYAPSLTTLDFGVRFRFSIAGHDSTARLLLANVFDHKSWKVIASNSLQVNDGRRLSLSFTIDY